MLSKISLISPIKNINFKKNFKQAGNDMPKYKYSNTKDSISFLQRNTIPRTDITEAISQTEPLSNNGLKGIVYKYNKNGKSYVIKVARSTKFEFDNEAKVLKSVPSNLNCQEFVDYFKHPITGCDILVSTFVEGKRGVLKEPEDFEKFLDTLLELDMGNILHGDLNMSNCLLNANGISLIDFGEGEVFKTGENYDDFIYPEFVIKSNIVNLEHNGIPDCIISWNNSDMNVLECFKNYLISKSQYYRKHADFLKTQNADLKEVINFEENYSEVLKNPSDVIIENEIRRIDCLYSFENVDTAVNFTKNPDEVIEIWKLIIQKTQNQLKFINDVLNSCDISNDERQYFKYQKEILELFHKQFNSWSSSTVEWLNSLPNKDVLTDDEQEFIKNKGGKTTLPPNLVQLVLN